MAGNIPPETEPIGKAALKWIMPILVVCFGLVCSLTAISVGSQTVVSGSKLFLWFLVLTVVGCLSIYKFRDFFVIRYNLKKIHVGDYVCLSALTFGCIPLCVFLLLNKTFVGKTEYSQTTRIVHKELRSVKISGGFYDRRVATSYTFEGEDFSEDLMPSSATDTAEYVVVRYKYGLFGCDVVTGISLK